MNDPILIRSILDAVAAGEMSAEEADALLGKMEEKEPECETEARDPEQSMEDWERRVEAQAENLEKKAMRFAEKIMTQVEGMLDGMESGMKDTFK